MRTIAFMIVLSVVLLSTAAFSGESATQATGTEASRINLDKDPASRGSKTDVPGLMNYQGTLTDGAGVALDTTVDMTFTIYTDSVGGTQVWTETQLAVAVGSGLFNVLLGRVNSIPDTVFKDPERWLGVTVGGDPELEPRQRIAAVGYAFRAATADTAEYAHSAPTVSDGDWTIVGDDVYHEVGNVGIGTPSPSATLEIVGDGIANHLMLTNTSTVGPAIRLNAANRDWVIMGSNPGASVGDQKLVFRDYSSAQDRMVIDQYGNVGIATKNPAAKLDVRGTLNIGEDDTGHDVNFYGMNSGSRLFWDESKMALRAGQATGSQWEDANVGSYSFAVGDNPTASGNYAVAMGYGPSAGGFGATATGWLANASGYVSTAMGSYATSAGPWSVAIGKYVIADSAEAYVLGSGISLIEPLLNDIESSLMVGFNDTTATLFVGGPDARVGVGTDSPAQKLDVAGTVQVEGFKMPTGASDGCIMTSDASGVGTWQTFVGDNDWVRNTPDSVLFTANHLGIARGGANNMLYGDSVHTHINLGVACTTGTSGQSLGYCTVAGGWSNTASNYYATVGGGALNTASGNVATVGGGSYNTASSSVATVSGGSYNTASDFYTTVGGGYSNTASISYATVGGGEHNTASNSHATVGGGEDNTASGYYATASGGYSNTASGEGATAGGGYRNYAEGEYSAILGGYADTITAAADYSYLFGIGSKLTQDSTMMVDMPHIRFGDETDGYEFPASDGSNGEVLVTNGSGTLSWQAPAPDDDWTILGSDMYSYRKVGIGTSSPQTNLHIRRATSGQALLDGTIGGSLFLGDYDEVADEKYFGINSQGGALSIGPADDALTSITAVFRMLRNGDVGIGGTDPEYKLDVRGSAGFADTIYHRGDNDTYMYFSTDQLDLYIGNIKMITANETTQDVLVINENSADVDFRVESDTYDNALFVHGADGNVGIGTSSPGYRLDIAGACHASSFPTSSDARLKTDIKELTNVLEKLQKVRGVSFEWNELYESFGRSTGHREIGVIAQEIENEFPELVTTWGEEDYRAVDYGRLTGVLIEAVKELNEGFKELEEENQLLKQRIEVLETSRR